MTSRVLVADETTALPVDPPISVTRVQLKGAVTSSDGKRPRRFWDRQTQPVTPSLTEALQSSSDLTIVVVTQEADLQRVRDIAPRAIVMSDLTAAIHVAQSAEASWLDTSESSVQADSENLYRIIPTVEQQRHRLVTADEAEGTTAITDGWAVAVNDQQIPGFIELQPDHVRFNGPVDVGYYGVRALTSWTSGAASGGSAPTPQLLIAPANYAGQSWAWSESIRIHQPDLAANNLQITPRAVSGFTARTSVTATEWRDPSIRLRLALDELLPASHVLIEAMRAIIGSTDPTPTAHGWDFKLAANDVVTIHKSGRKVGLLFHGSEIRSPRIHATMTSASPFLIPEHADGTAKLQQTTDTVHDLVAELREQIPGLDLFVSTPDLLDYLPDATWLPVVVPTRSFDPAPPVLTQTKPRVLHAPTNPFLKGSDIADEMLTRLATDGLIDYIRVQGVNSIFMPDLIREVDVVVDQIVLGNPGVLAAETMSAGRLAVAHLPDHVRARFPLPPPIVEASRTTLEDVIRDICARRSYYAQVAGRGPGFARQVHGGASSAHILASFLRN